MQTLRVLHGEAELAHLDLTSNNIMFSSPSGRLKVSDLRVIDFGFAQDSPGQRLSMTCFLLYKLVLLRMIA